MVRKMVQLNFGGRRPGTSALRMLLRLTAVKVASWLARSTTERALRVRSLARNIVLFSWARHLTLTVPLSTQVYKCVPPNLMLGVTLRWTSIPVASCYRNRDKLRPNGPECRLYLPYTDSNCTYSYIISVIRFAKFPFLSYLSFVPE